MKYFISILLSILLFSCKETSSQSKISNLEKFEIAKNISETEQIFHPKAVVSYPDGLPVCGLPAIIKLYEYLWQKNALKTQKYLLDSTQTMNGDIIEYGRVIFQENNSKMDTFTYKAKFVRQNNLYLIKEIIYGNNELILPELPKPTGKYAVGKTFYFKDKNETENKRTISFEIWYPCKYNNEPFAQYRSLEQTTAVADFLGWPYFMNSFSSEVKTNSYLNSNSVRNMNFPVVIYNHGYGGFSSVYQSIFEELASHGYVVVSLNHQDESALLVVDNDSIIENCSQNEFYASRQTELNGIAINALQNTILNSDNTHEVSEAYSKLIELSHLNNESTKCWASDTKEAIRLLKEINSKCNLLKNSMDLEKIGVFGHSVGGATAGELSYGNKQIKAAINLDGFQFGSLINNQIEIPFMFISSNQEGSRYLRYSNFIENAKNDCYHTVISGFTHGSFTDLELFKPNGYEILSPQRTLILNFFNKYLKDKDVDLTAIETIYQNIKITKYE